MDRSYIDSNKSELQRLREVLASLSDSDLDRPLAHGWTVAAALAHLAFWDRRSLSALQEWERSGAPSTPVDIEAVNEANLSEWLAVETQDVAVDVLKAAEAVDQKVEALPTHLAEAILARRPLVLVRALHRSEHLDQIERVLAS